MESISKKNTYILVQAFFRLNDVLMNLTANKEYPDKNTIRGDVRLLDKEISDETYEIIYSEYKDELRIVRSKLDSFLNAL